MKTLRRRLLETYLYGMALAVGAALLMCVAISPAVAQEEGEGIGEAGTDPRDFAPKFMPYYRYTELENGLEQNEVVVFGLVAFSNKFAMTYEIPLAMERDVTNTALNGAGGTPGVCSAPTGQVPVPPATPTLPNGIKAEGDCEETGLGDMNLRFMYRLDWNFLGADWLVGSEFWFPTATDDVLGTEKFRIAPMITPIWDLGFWPAPGAFMALMNFYEFDAFGETSRGDISMYKGRYFWMLPLHRSGIYALPEIQFIYDFENSDSSFWFGPEFGKLLAPGRIIYVKPGWGIATDSLSGERDFTFEFGFRYFFD